MWNVSAAASLAPSLSMYSNFTNTISSLESGQPSSGGIELTFQSKSYMKKLGFLCTHGKGEESVVYTCPCFCEKKSAWIIYRLDNPHVDNRGFIVVM
jgi:hypothetical protein